MESRRATSKEWRLICSQRGQGNAKEGTAVDSRFSFPGLCLGMLGLQVPMRPGSIDDPGVGGVGLPRRRTPVHGNSRFTVLALSPFLLFASDGLAFSVRNDHRGVGGAVCYVVSRRPYGLVQRGTD